MKDGECIVEGIAAGTGDMRGSLLTSTPAYGDTFGPETLAHYRYNVIDIAIANWQMDWVTSGSKFQWFISKQQQIKPHVHDWCR